MNRTFNFKTGLVALMACCVAALAAGATNETTVPSTNAPASRPPESARDFFNAGTQKLGEKKLNEAEALLKIALAKQERDLQPRTLYNLGHVRFAQGAEQLKKGPSAKSLMNRSRDIGKFGGQVVQRAEEALEENDVQKMVEAYLAGRTARKEARDVLESFKRALSVYGITLRKWQRSLDDFKSTVELNPADTNAQHNVKVVEEAIAKLLEEMRQMQQALMPMPGNSSQFNQMMSELKGRIPDEMIPADARGGDEEDDIQVEQLRGRKEGPSKEGEENEVSLSPEEAGDLLKSLQLEEKHGLPLDGESGDSKLRTGKPW